MTQASPILERRFSGLVSKIHSGECVLILGPRIAIPHEVAGGPRVPIEEYLSGRLMSDLGAETQSAFGLREAVARYEKEKSAPACRSFIQEVVSDFDQYTTELHTDLAALPFRLVLVATPDRMMANALRSRGKPNVQEACYNYCRGVSAETPLTLPATDRPIVYSLFGRHDQPESMVLNDKNLLDYLVRVIKESPALPDAVRATVRAPSMVFLFVGFGFRNWWLRLLLKVLEVTGVERWALSLALEDTTFDASGSEENRAFFESVGIFIQSRDDWNSLVRYLASTFRPPEINTAAGQSSGPTPGKVGDARPLVFLSYASEDAARVETLRVGLASRGISAWEDKQNLRVGQNWSYQIERIIGSVDYFIFVQSDNMDRRDQGGKDGVYNWELKEALARQRKRPYGAVFILHVTAGSCVDRPEPELAALHHIAVDTDAGIQEVAEHILSSYQEIRSAASQAV